MSDPIDPNLYSWLTRVGAVPEEEPARPRPVLPSPDERAAFYESLVSQGLGNAVEWLTNRDQMAEMTGNPYYPIRNPAHTGAINYAMQSPLLDTAVEGTSGYMNRLAQGQGDLRAVGGGFSDAARHVMENAGAYLDPNQAVEGRSWADVPGMEMPAWQALAADAGTSMFDLMPGLGRGMFSAAGAADPRQITGPVDAPTMRRWAEDLLSLHNEATMRRATNATPEAVEGIQTAAGSFRNTLPDVLNMILESADDTTLNYFRNDPAAQVTLTNMEEVLANALRTTYTEGRSGTQGAAERARAMADRVQDALTDDFGVDPAVAQEASNEIFRRGFGTGRRVAGSPGQGVRQAAQERGLNPGYGGARFDPLSHGLKQFGDYRMVENLAPDLWQDFVRRGELADVQANVRQADYQQPGGEVRRLPRNYNPDTAPMGAQDVSPDAFGPAAHPTDITSNIRLPDEVTGAFGRIWSPDGSGTPTVVYHGTGTTFDVPRASPTGAHGPGYYFTTNPEKAGEYAGRGDAPQIRPAYISRSDILNSSDRTPFQDRQAERILRNLEGTEIESPLRSRYEQGDLSPRALHEIIYSYAPSNKFKDYLIDAGFTGWYDREMDIGALMMPSRTLVSPGDQEAMRSLFTEKQYGANISAYDQRRAAEALEEFGPAQTNQPSNQIFSGMGDDEAQETFDRIAYEGMYRERVGPHLEQPELDHILTYVSERFDDPSADWMGFYNEISGFYTGQSGAPVDAIERAARRHGVPMDEVYQIPGPGGRPVLDPRRLEQGVPADALGELRARQMLSGDKMIQEGEEQNLWDHRNRVAEGERILEENELYGPPYTEAAAPEGVELGPGERLVERPASPVRDVSNLSNDQMIDMLFRPLQAFETPPITREEWDELPDEVRDGLNRILSADERNRLDEHLGLLPPPDTDPSVSALFPGEGPGRRTDYAPGVDSPDMQNMALRLEDDGTFNADVIDAFQDFLTVDAEDGLTAEDAIDFLTNRSPSPVPAETAMEIVDEYWPKAEDLIANQRIWSGDEKLAPWFRQLDDEQRKEAWANMTPRSKIDLDPNAFMREFNFPPTRAEQEAAHRLGDETGIPPGMARTLDAARALIERAQTHGYDELDLDVAEEFLDGIDGMIAWGDAVEEMGGDLTQVERNMGDQLRRVRDELQTAWGYLEGDDAPAWPGLDLLGEGPDADDLPSPPSFPPARDLGELRQRGIDEQAMRGLSATPESLHGSGSLPVDMEESIGSLMEGVRQMLDEGQDIDTYRTVYANVSARLDQIAPFLSGNPSDSADQYAAMLQSILNELPPPNQW